MNQPIYLDYAATGPIDPNVAEKMSEHIKFEGSFGNPASRSHRYGWQAEEAVEAAREQIANLIQADPREIVFTSGATESNNLAIKGASQFYSDKGKHIITVRTEHKAVLDTCEWMESQGFEVSYLEVDSDGLLDLAQLKNSLRQDTVLVTVMHVNNELGVIQDIESIGRICKEAGVLFHVDAAQSAGKVAIDLSTLPVDLMSFSGHKIYGPKGIGALFVRRQPRVRLEAQIHGGGHERGMRSGTLATHQIVGMGEAFHQASQLMEKESLRISQLRDLLWQHISKLPAVTLNGSENQRVSGILNVSFGFVEGETLLMALRELAVSSGSACTSASMEPSYVLKALGLDDELAHSSIRFSVGRFSTEEEVNKAGGIIVEAVSKLREISPEWQEHQGIA